MFVVERSTKPHIDVTGGLLSLHLIKPRIKSSVYYLKPFHFISNRCREQSNCVCFFCSSFRHSVLRFIETSNKLTGTIKADCVGFSKKLDKVFCVDSTIISFILSVKSFIFEKFLYTKRHCRYI